MPRLVRGKKCFPKVALLLAMAVGIGIVFAADHRDSPSVQGDDEARADITDVFVFRSPENSDNLVFVLGLFSPEGGAPVPPLFDQGARYEFYVDTDGDFSADDIIRVTVDSNDTFEAEGVPSADDTISGNVTPVGAAPVIVTGGQARVFLGLVDDPFFFDLEAFNAFVAAPCIPTAGLRCPGTGAPVNFFNGRNLAAIVIEFPATALSNIESAQQGTLRVWAKTFREPL